VVAEARGQTFFSTDVDAAIEAADMILLLLILLLRLTERMAALI
jgi:hypothetical protein